MNRCRTVALLLLWSALVPAGLQAQPVNPSPASSRPPASANHVLVSPLGSGSVLTLTGNGHYLELPADLFTGLNEATLECWVKWHSFTGNQHVFEFDAAKRVKVGNRVGQADLEFMAAAPPAAVPANAQPPGAAPAGLGSNLSPIEFEKSEAAATSPETSDSIVQTGTLALNRWHQLAVVFDERGTRLYLDGTLAGTAPYTKGLASAGSAARHFIGSCSLYPNNSFRGDFDEVRLWRVARTADQIRQSLTRSLTGKEAGLAGLWNFDDPANPGRDASPNGNNATLVGAAPVVSASGRLITPVIPVVPGVVTGNVLSLDGTRSYVELPPAIFTNLTAATIEARVLWRSFDGVKRVFNYGDARDDFSLGADGPNVWFIKGEQPVSPEIKLPGLLVTNQWYHLAGVTGPGGMRLYLDGVLVGTHAFTGSFSIIKSPARNYLGQRVTLADTDTLFDGQIDEVRVWNLERTQEQIRENLTKNLIGRNPVSSPCGVLTIRPIPAAMPRPAGITGG